MPSFVKIAWASHPVLTGLEVLIALLVACELVLGLHLLAGWLWGVATRNPDAFVYTRFVFMTGQDAGFALPLIALFLLLPACLVLGLVGGAGFALAHLKGAPGAAYGFASLGGLGVALVTGVVGIALRSGLGGGLIPH